MEDTKVEEEVKTKRCSKCGRILPLSEFSKDKSRKDGLQLYCKDCKKELAKAYYAKHSGEIVKKVAEWSTNHKENVKAKNAKWRAKNPTYNAQYQQAHKDKIAEYKAAYSDPQKNPLGWAKMMVNNYRQMDRDRGFDDKDTISAQWFLEHIAYNPCAHCGKVGYGLIGCNRLNNTKGHTIDNVESCCFKCNARENIRDQIERGLAWFQKRKKQSFKTFVEENKAKDKNLT